MSELVLVANAGDGTISTLRLHTDGEPRLETLATSPVGKGTGTFAVDVERKLVHASYKGDPPGIVTLSLDPDTGELTELARRDVDASLAYLALAREGTLLLGASYGGGFGAVWPVEGERVGEPVARIEYANLHSVVPHGEYAYFVSLGDDLVAQYRLGDDGSLTPLDPPTVPLTDGSGPRHLIVQGSNAYLVTEYSGEALRLAVQSDGTLTPEEAVAVYAPDAGLSHSRFGADPTAEHLIWGADVHVAGPWLLCSERTVSTIATVALEAGGRLGDVVAITPTEKQPRGFATSPDGAYVVAVGEKSTDAALSRVEADGSLTLLQREPIGSGANWVRFVSL